MLRYLFASFEDKAMLPAQLEWDDRETFCLWLKTSRALCKLCQSQGGTQLPVQNKIDCNSVFPFRTMD